MIQKKEKNTDSTDEGFSLTMLFSSISILLIVACRTSEWMQAFLLMDFGD